MKPKALVLHATGTNRDHDAAEAVELAGGLPEIVHLNQLRRGERHWHDYQMLLLPGGFSYADALGAGRLLALDLIIYFADAVLSFINSGKPVIGICNGFQALVKAGILPDPQSLQSPRTLTLTHNTSGNFECRWVSLLPSSETCIWTKGLHEIIFCPTAHGEGRLRVHSPAVVEDLIEHDQVALVYARPDGSPAGDLYPENPNGSVAGIAGICNRLGNVLGLMPHPENHIHPWQFPYRSLPPYGSGLKIFKNGIAYASQL
ncbi:MAG: phosphoribosylformylglycinamidine synthase I [Anaerolineaceae bacterium]|nr:phosphoribosylformylglycinamidine synthase I [Anaerolineaceae bacterium]